MATARPPAHRSRPPARSWHSTASRSRGRARCARRGGSRVLARDLIASRDVPPFARSMWTAMRCAPPTPPAQPRITSRLSLVEPRPHGPRGGAGGPGRARASRPGLPCRRCRRHRDRGRHVARGDRVAVHRAAAPRQHVGRAGSDLVAGELAATAGTLLSPARIGVAAALGLDTLDVYARPRVAILSTGDALSRRAGRFGRADLRLEHGRLVRRRTAAWRRTCRGAPDRRRSRGAGGGLRPMSRRRPRALLGRHLGRRPRLSAGGDRRRRRLTSRDCCSSPASPRSLPPRPGVRSSGCRAIPSRVSPTHTCWSRRSCAGWRTCRLRRRFRVRPAPQPGRLACGASPDLPGARRGWRGGTGLQGVWRNHQPGPRRRLLRDPAGIESVEAGTIVDVTLF